MAVQNIRVSGYDIRQKQDLRKGVLFDKDRKFKNRLILKAILSMTVLVLIAIFGFILWSKSREPKDAQSKTHVTTIIRKVPLASDLDEEVTELERVVVPEVRTQFVPAYVETPPRQQRHVRDVASSLDEDGSNAHRYVILQKSKESAESVRKSQAEKMKSYMDENADPCDDFYQYACGRWNEKNAIPQDRAGFDTFEMLRDSLDLILRDLLEENITGDSHSAIGKSQILYRSCMNEELLEKRGKEPLLELISSLGGWPVLQPNWNDTHFDWVDLAAKLRLYYNDILITHWVGQDFMASSNYIIQFDQANLGLSTRDHFLKDQNKPYRDAYKIYITETATLLGADPSLALADAEDIVLFETALANITTPQEERRNISQMYEKLTVASLEDQMPHISWRSYLSTVLGWNVSSKEPVVLFARRYFTRLGQLISTTPSRTIANYMMWRFVKHRANNLSSQFQEVKQNFLHALFGREKSPQRWTTCVHHVNGNLGMALGSLFVQRYFDENSKNDTVIMTKSIMDTFRDILDGVNWIDEDTRRLAQEKVQAITLRIGYPDFILDRQKLDDYFANVQVTEDNYFENTLNVLRFVAKTEQNRLRISADKNVWTTPPAIVNAYYSRNKNQILFPAGILQPPFYHKHFPRSLNYGGIGVVIGHEIIHGFDDKGRLYDLEGNLNRWWREDAIQSFHVRAKCLIDQYNSYVVQEVDMKIDGVNTQGENIADNGGIKQAFKAYENWLRRNNASMEEETLDGINATNFQIFFINFAQVWCGSMRPEAFRNKLQTAVHPPGRYRVIGTLSNSEDFARTFNCPVGSPMNPKDKCTVW